MARGGEYTVAALILLGICGLALYRFVVWVMQAPHTPDPWDTETEEALNEETAVPLCHHCLTPQTHNGWFCPQCGATVGPYCNYMPYIYVFSQGEVLRAGVTEKLRHSALVLVGFLLFSLGMFSFTILGLVVPVYWFFFFKNLKKHNEPQTEENAASP